MLRAMLALPRVLTPPLAAHFGVTRSRIRTELRRGNWRRIAANIVLTRPDEPTREDWATVGVHLAGRGAAVTGWDALRVRGLGERQPPRAPVVVLSARMNDCRVIGNVHLRGTRRPFATSRAPLNGSYELLPVVGVARAVADASLLVGPRGALAMVTQAVQREKCSVEELRLEYESGPRNRSAGLRRAVDSALDGARSVAEAQAAARLCAAVAPAFELNVPVVDENGTLLYVLDQLWRGLRAAVEIDSREFHSSEDDWQRTLVRHNALTRRGLALLHYSPKLVTCRGSTFAADVMDWLADRADELRTPLPVRRGVLRTASVPEPLVLPARRPRAA